MKIINNSTNHAIVVLEDNDVLEVTSLKKNHEKLIIKNKNSVIHIDELTIKEINDITEEKENIESMKKYLDKNERF